MKCLLMLLLALGHILPVYCADEIACGPSNCDCDLSKYTITVVPANVTVECSNGEMDIYISKCQLQKNNFNIYNLELSNNTGSECNNLNVSVNNEPQLAFHNPLAFGKCGNNITINESYVTFSNVLKIYTTSSHIISRNNVSVTVSCTFPLNYTITLNTTLKPKLATAQLTIPGVFGAVTVLMALYKDETFTEQITDANSDLSIDSYVYVGFNIPSLQASTFSIKVISIQASTLENGGDVYNLTKGLDGCPDPSFGTDLISVIQNGNGSEARYKLKVFKIANNDYVYLSARVTICSTLCLPQCNGARIAKSGDTSSSQNVAVMEMDVFTSNDYTSGATDRFSKTSASMLLISLLLFVKLI